MGVWMLTVLLLTTAVTSIVSAEEGNREDMNSVAALASNMNNKFQQLFQRFDQLEFKVNQLIRRQNEQGGGATVDGTGDPESVDEDRVTPGSCSMAAQLNASLREVSRFDGQGCAPCPECDLTAKGKLIQAEEEVQRTHKALNSAMAQSKSSIYFATYGGQLKAYSLETSQASTVASPGDRLRGVAYDSMENEIYFCSEEKIYRANPDGTNLETLLNTTQYGPLEAMAFDWITGNIYVVTRKDYILACDTRPTRPFRCATVSNNAGYIQGIALNPLEGAIFYTTYKPNKSIMRASMDGSNPVTLMSVFGDFYGITIDFKTSRLFWADSAANKVESSNFQGSDRRIVVQNADPYEIAVANERIYWGGHASKKLQSSTTTGDDVVTLHDDTSYLHQVLLVPNFDLPRNRTNHCARHTCAKVCVLTATSFRCLD